MPLRSVRAGSVKMAWMAKWIRAESASPCPRWSIDRVSAVCSGSRWPRMNGAGSAGRRPYFAQSPGTLVLYEPPSVQEVFGNGCRRLLYGIRVSAGMLGPTTQVYEEALPCGLLRRMSFAQGVGYVR